MRSIGLKEIVTKENGHSKDCEKLQNNSSMEDPFNVDKQQGKDGGAFRIQITNND